MKACVLTRLSMERGKGLQSKMKPCGKPILRFSKCGEGIEEPVKSWRGRERDQGKTAS